MTMTRPPFLCADSDKKPSFRALKVWKFLSCVNGNDGQILFFQKCACALVENRMGYIFETSHDHSSIIWERADRKE
jgi:hypothetical protein